MLDALATQQARVLHRAIAQAGIPVPQLWVHYLSIGGSAGEREVEAYPHQALHLPRFERKLLDHAARELIEAPPG